MAHKKSQIKRNKTNEKKRLRNAAFKSSLKTAIKNALAAIEAGNKEEAVVAVNFASKKLDKAVSKGLKHKNYVARKKSELMTKVNKMA